MTQLRVRQLEIVDDDNIPRIHLRTNTEGGEIRIRDSSLGYDVLFLGAGMVENVGLSGIIEVLSHNHRPYIRLSRGSYGGSISVTDPMGQDKIALSVNQSRSGQIVVFGSNFERAAYIGSGIDAEGNDAGGLVAAYSSNWDDGFAFAGLGVSEEQAFLQVSSKKNKEMFFVNVQEGHAFSQMKNDNFLTMMMPGFMTAWKVKSKKPIVSYGSTTLGQGFMITFDENGNQTIPGILFPEGTVKFMKPPPTIGIIVD